MTNVRLPLYVCAAIAIFFCHRGVNGEDLSDPTRPPGVAPASQSNSDHSAVAALQSVIITPKYRAAIINGERVELGGQYAGARIIKISESEVVLRSAGGTEVLRMYPNVDKALAPARPVKAIPKAQREKSSKE